MVNRKSQLKKLKVNELKEIIKTNKLGNVSGKKKGELIEQIGTHQKFKEIKSNITIPKRTRKPPSKKQIKARQNFQKMVFERHNKIHMKKEGLGISIKELAPKPEIKEITKKPKRKFKQKDFKRTGRSQPPALMRPRTP